MTRRNCEIDLPTRFSKLYAKEIEAFLADAIPGMTLNIVPITPGSIPLSPFVTTSSFERNIITLRAVDLSGVSGPVILLEPADAHSRRLIEKEEARLKAYEPPIASQEAHGLAYRGGSQPLMSGVPVTGQFGGYTGW
jgi:hypothetical protein